MSSWITENAGPVLIVFSGFLLIFSRMLIIIKLSPGKVFKNKLSLFLVFLSVFVVTFAITHYTKPQFTYAALRGTQWADYPDVEITDTGKPSIVFGKSSRGQYIDCNSLTPQEFCYKPSSWDSTPKELSPAWMTSYANDLAATAYNGDLYIRYGLTSCSGGCQFTLDTSVTDSEMDFAYSKFGSTNKRYGVVYSRGSRIYLRYCSAGSNCKSSSNWSGRIDVGPSNGTPHPSLAIFNDDYHVSYEYNNKLYYWHMGCDGCANGSKLVSSSINMHVSGQSSIDVFPDATSGIPSIAWTDSSGKIRYSRCSVTFLYCRDSLATWLTWTVSSRGDGEIIASPNALSIDNEKIPHIITGGDFTTETTTYHVCYESECITSLEWQHAEIVRNNPYPGINPRWQGIEVDPTGGIHVVFSDSSDGVYYASCLSSCAVRENWRFSITPDTDLSVNYKDFIYVRTGSQFNIRWQNDDLFTPRSLCNAYTVGPPSSFWNGPKEPTGGSISGVSENVAGSYNYEIRCDNEQYVVTDEATVYVQDPVTVDLKLNGLDTTSSSHPSIPSGVEYDLAWVPTAATSCTGSASPASSFWSGSKGSSGGSQKGTEFPSSTTTYRYDITCANNVSSATDSVYVTVTVTHPPSVELKANGVDNVTVKTDEQFSLSWQNSNAESCTAKMSVFSPSQSVFWSGHTEPTTNPDSGSVTDSEPTPGTRIYDLYCANTVGTNFDYVTVDVVPVIPTVNLKANNSDGPVSVNVGDNINMSWSSDNADECAGSMAANSPSQSTFWPGRKSVNGSQQDPETSAGQRIYQLTCLNIDGTSNDTVSVDVVPVLPFVDLQANNSDGPIDVGTSEPFTMSWYTANVENCLGTTTQGVSQFWDEPKNPSPSYSIPETQGGQEDAPGERTYQLSCLNNDGTHLDDVDVNVLAQQTGVQFQIAVSSSPSGPWNFTGPGCDPSTWYSGLPAVPQTACGSGRYFRYRVKIERASGALPSPTLGEVRLRYE